MHRQLCAAELWCPAQQTLTSSKFGHSNASPTVFYGFPNSDSLISKVQMNIRTQKNASQNFRISDASDTTSYMLVYDNMNSFNCQRRYCYFSDCKGRLNRKLPQCGTCSPRVDARIPRNESEIMSRQTAVRAREEAESLLKRPKVKEAENGKARGEHL